MISGRATKQPYFQAQRNIEQFIETLTKPKPQYVRVVKTSRIERNKDVSKAEIVRQLRTSR